MDSLTHRRLLALYPVIAGLPEADRATVLARDASLVRVPAAARLFDAGAPCAGFPLVLEGEVRVARGARGGRSLELYRVGPGEICVVSAAGLVGEAALSASGESCGPTELLLLSAAGFERWCEHAAFRRWVFGNFAQRLADLMMLAEAVAFHRLDQRLALALLAHARPTAPGEPPSLRGTHQALADELGTVREIVSRLLARFEREGWVTLARERIELRDLPALQAAAAPRS